jgi:hypothetical protein
MSGLHFAFGLVVAVLLAAGLFGGRRPRSAAVIMILVGWGALVLGGFTAELFGQVSRDAGEVIEILFRTTAGAGLVIGSLLELLGRRQDSAA